MFDLNRPGEDSTADPDNSNTLTELGATERMDSRVQ